MPQTAYVGIDVACAKRKRLPLAACVFSVGRLEAMPLRDWSTRPPLGEGNLMALETEFQEWFAEDTVRHLREVEAHFSVKIKRIAIDAPSDASRHSSFSSSSLRVVNGIVAFPRQVFASKSPLWLSIKSQ
jgi:hypothetical protein